MEKRIAAFLIFFLVLVQLVSAQTFRIPDPEDPETGGPALQYYPAVPLVVEESLDTDRIRLIAISSEEYPVTPGDVYSLTFRMGGQMVSYELLVDSDYSINLDVIGEIVAEGMRFQEVKPLIEERISESYYQSFPSLQILSVGIFQIPVTGEVPDVKYHTAWGLTRLSELIEGNVGPYSSIRTIQIKSRNGEVRTYDLQLALNQNKLDENPFVKPGDTIIVDRVSRVVEVQGGVYRPGEYQLLEDEGVAELEAFFNGYTPKANASRIKVVRITGNRPVTRYLKLNEFQNDFPLHDGDIIYVPLKTTNQPIVFIEGGVDVDEDNELTTETDETVTPLDEYNRLTLPISIGDTLYDALYEIRDDISSFAKLAHGYIIRDEGPDDKVYHVNMEQLLYNYDLTLDIELQPFDRIIIPQRRPSVTVLGAVNDPGRYPYSPPELYNYYLSLAGGVNTARNENGEVIIKDEAGNTRPDTEPVQPGDTIQVLENNFLYNYNTYIPAIATGLTLLTSIITLILAISQ